MENESVRAANEMRVLIACEESQRVCMEFRKLGFEAYSCDLLPTSGKHKEWHIQADATEIAKLKWDAVIAFPPCTHLASSGASWFDQKRRDGRQQMGIGFFLFFTALDDVPNVAIENPIGIMSSVYRKPDQVIQPYWFGDRARKSTCLWLKGFPKLQPTNIVDPGEIAEGGFSIGAAADMARDENGKAIAWNDPRTAMIRSKTFPGVAKAMAIQWGEYLINTKVRGGNEDYEGRVGDNSQSVEQLSFL